MLGRRKEEPERTDSHAPKLDMKGVQEQMATILSADAHFKGSLSFEKALKIEGNFEGDISTTGTLYIGKEAKVKAEIKAGNVYVDGVVHGNVVATDKVELRSTAKLSGDIKAAKLVVEEGAALVGRCEVSLKSMEKDLGKGLGELLGKPSEVGSASK